MNRLSKKYVLCGITAFSTLIGVLPAPSQAQVKQQSSPPAAPSFLKQAGQMLLNNAQKNVLHGVNQTIQQQQAPAQTTAPGYSSDPTSLLYNQKGASPTSSKQAAPCRSWVDPNEKPIAALLCIHGLGLQSNSYEYFGTEQSKRGLAVYAIDVRGFGSWMKAGGKGNVNFDEALSDIKQTCESIRAANPGIPLYVLGESMGGAIALRAASMYPELIDGLISSVPAGERFNQGKTSMKVFLNLLSGFNVANVGQDIVNQATQNAKLKSQWQGDPLSRLNLSPQELIQFQDFMNMNHEAAKKVASMPVLFVQGNGDQLVKPEGTWELFNDVASKDKSFFAVPGEHLIFEEAQTQEPGLRDQNFRVVVLNGFFADVR
ncbi:MAG TPA: alpha/beta fold hydrolase, partial [Candidatus Melainabacteria bacterium]|nr:alpha/beta fold hydrolase [Candidatus Melainabacteria bacterium]